jgi:SAM-dependent methyltransferase
LAESVSNLPLPELLREAYQSFDAGEIVRGNFRAYSTKAVSVLRNELAECGLGCLSGIDKPSFFDYGCGGGHFLWAAKTLGFEVMGMELDAASVEFGRAHGLDVRLASLPANLAMVEGKKFDLIKSMHVLEHVPEPLSTLRALHGLMKPGGIMILSVPDQASFPSLVKKALRVFGVKRADWGFVQPPIHLHGYRYRTLQRVGEVLGLNVVSIRKTSPLDGTVFPTTPDYWKGLQVHRLVYVAGRILGSGGHFTAIYRQGSSLYAA